MAKRSKLNKHVRGRKDVEVVDLLEIEEGGEALEIEVGVEALVIVVGMTGETIEEEVEVASTATRVDIWQEIVLKKTADEEEVVVVSEEEEAVVVVAELATTATKTDIWQENVPKKTAEIVEDDRLYLTGSFKKPTGIEYLKD